MVLNISDAISTFGNMTFATVSEESLILEFKEATERKNKKGEVTSYAVKPDATPKSISINWIEEQDGSQSLHFKHKTELVASFTFHNNDERTMDWKPGPAFGVRSMLIAKPVDPEVDVIVSYSLYNFFEQWVLSPKFSVGLNQLAAELIYPPAVVKLLLLFIGYMTERTRQAELLKKLSADADLHIDYSRVAVMYHNFLTRLIGTSKRMGRLYSDAFEYIPLPSNKDEILQLIAQEVEIPEVEKKEEKTDDEDAEIIPIIEVEVTQPIQPDQPIVQTDAPTEESTAE